MSSPSSEMCKPEGILLRRQDWAGELGSPSPLPWLLAVASGCLLALQSKACPINPIASVQQQDLNPDFTACLLWECGR